MSDPESHRYQLQRLAVYRERLNHLLQQLAIHGKANVSFDIVHGISECRREIRQIKEHLSAQGVSFDDSPIDNEVENVATDNRNDEQQIPPSKLNDYLYQIAFRLLYGGFTCQEDITIGNITFRYILNREEKTASPTNATRCFFYLYEHKHALDLPAFKQLRASLVEYAKSQAGFLPITFFCFVILAPTIEPLVASYIISTPHDFGMPLVKAYATGVSLLDKSTSTVYYYDMEREITTKSWALRLVEYVVLQERYNIINALHETMYPIIMNPLDLPSQPADS